MPGDMAWVRFYQNSVYQSFRSEKEGRPIYEPVDFIEIRFPGDDKQIVDRAVKPEDKTDPLVERRDARKADTKASSNGNAQARKKKKKKQGRK